MLNLGDYPVNAVIDFKWPTQGAAGQSITRATDGTIRVYKNNSATERSSGSGITDTEDFDTLTGVHHLRIDLGDNTDAGFYAAGSEYQVVLVGAVIDGQTVNYPLAHFSIERAGGILALLKSGSFGLSAIKTAVDGVPASAGGRTVEAAAGGAPAITMDQALRILIAGLTGRSSGHDTFNPVYKNPGNTKTRFSGTSDGFGNRTAVTLGDLS